MRATCSERPILGCTATFVPICDRCGGTILSPYEVSNGVSVSDVTTEIDYLAEPYHELCIVKDGVVTQRLMCPHCGAVIDVVRIPFGTRDERSKKTNKEEEE